MASIIKVDNVQNTPGTNIVSKCGTDVTLGASGDTVALASGASQTGFGRTGTVDWVTTPKVTGDSPITAATGSGYFLNTTAGTITINLPAGAAGSIVSVADYAGTWQTNAVTVAANGTEKIGGVPSAPVALDTEGQSITLVYVDATQGWVNTMDSTSNVRGNPYVVATGGTPCTGTIVGDYKIHTFTGPGTFIVSNGGAPTGSNTVDYYVVAGGGSGGGDDGGGGGAGGFRESVPSPAAWTGSPLANPGNARPVTATPYSIAVGAGGATATACMGNAGLPSTFSDITSAGGGAGLRADPDSSLGDGGSGGGADVTAVCGGASSPVTSPAQGTAGGNSAHANSGGGGGGATVAGSPNPGHLYGGAGGAGATSEFNDSPVVKAGGGGGGGPTAGGAGGPGGGGKAAIGSPAPGGDGAAGTINSGSGGGGGATIAGPRYGGAGGSGIVILRYKFQ